MRSPLLATTLAVLALPAAALAAPSHGTVLSVDRAHHVVRVVDPRHRVHDLRFNGRFARLHAGSRITFQARKGRITRLDRVRARARSVSFYARVVRSSARGLVLRLPDGRRLRFSSHQVRQAHRAAAGGRRRHAVIAHMAGGPQGTLTINILGLAPGTTVLVTESLGAGAAATITLTLPAAQANPGGGDVTGGDSGSGGDSGAGGDASGSDDAVGTITAVSPTGLTVSSADQGALTFTVDSPEITSGYAVGDVVDVSYDPAADGSLDAVDVEYAEQDVTGTVSSVSAGSLTLSDDSGNTQTFSGDSTQGVFDGVSTGDQVDVTYHQSAGALVADVVDDQTVDGGDGSDGSGDS